MKKILFFLPLLLALVLLPALSPSVQAQEEDRIRVACVGDSITDGGSDFTEYPANLQKFLDASRYEVKNFGFGGTTAMKNPHVVPSYWSKQQYTDSKKYQPDVVILMLGTNDVVNENWDPEDYRNDLLELVQIYQALASQPTVYLCTPPTAFDSSHPKRLAEYAIPTVKEIAQETGATLVDVNTLTAQFKAEGLMNDDIHPNKKGYVKLAQIFYEEIFGGTPVELKIIAEPGSQVVFAGQKETVGEKGYVTLVTGDGTKTVKIERPGVGYATVEVEVAGNTVADCTGLKIPENLAFSATAKDKAGAVTRVNDGDGATNWQRDANESYNDVWLEYDFGSEKEIAGMELEWEDTTRPPEGKYTLTYSTDGVTWKNFSGLTIAYTNTVDTVSFDTVSARYVKLKIAEGTGGKYRPSLFEWRVHGPTEPFTPTVTQHVDETVPGDVDLSGTVQAADLTKLARHVAAIETLTEDKAILAADVDDTGRVDAADLTGLARHLGGIEQLE